MKFNNNLSAVIIAPMTTKSHNFPTRVELTFKKKTGWMVLDQIRTVDRFWLMKKMGKIDTSTVLKVKSVIAEMLIE